MALQVEVDCLNKDELLFELRIRGVDVTEESTLDELKQQLRASKGLTPDVNKACRNLFSNMKFKKEPNMTARLVFVARQDKAYLEGMIISSKGSVEKAKKRIDKVCTMRTMVPSLFKKCHAKHDFPNLKDFYVSVNVPSAITDDNYRLYIVVIKGKPLTSSIFLQGYQQSVLLSEYMKLYDYTLGYHVICDLREANIMDVVTSMDLVDFRNVVSLYTDAYGFRIKSINVLSSSTMIGAFVDLLKQVMSSKIGGRISVCKSLEALHDCLPKRLLPEDYGGEQKSSMKIYDEWVEELSLEKHVEYFKEMRGACTNEKFRRADKFNDEYLGMPGSFKSLHVD